MNETLRDDLTEIPGIGPVRQRWLHEELGVETYEQLAAFSADELEARVKEAGRSVSRSDIERWITEAEQLAAAEPAEAAPDLPENEPEEEKWTPFASFVVEYQEREEDDGRRTTIHHMEEDKDADWPHVAGAELALWMLEQIHEPAPDLEEEMRARAQKQLENKLAEREAEARRQLEQALAEERAAMQQEVQEEVEGRKAEELRQLEQELAQERAERRQALEEELQQRRAEALRQAEADLAEQRTEAEQALEQELAQERAKRQQALEEELQQRRAEALRQAEADLAEQRAEAEQALEQELAARREAAVQALEQELEEMRAADEEEPEEEVEAPAEAPPPIEAEGEAEPEAPRPPARVPVEKPIAFTIVDVRGYQPPHTADPKAIEGNGRAPALLKHDSPFTILVSFELEEDEATALAERGATYAVHVHARDLATGATQQLGRTRPARFVQGKRSYVEDVSQIELAAGLYQLTVLVTTETTPPGVGYRVVPMLLIT